MYNRVIVVSLMVAVTYFAGAEALSCNVGCTTAKTPEDCQGSCVKITIGKTDVFGCSPVHMPDGCREYMGIKACFCNTEKCEPGRNDLSAFFAFIGIKASRERDGGLGKL